jgi:hypothetical protein
MTPYLHLLSWLQFSSSNYVTLNSHPSSCASHGQTTHMPFRIIQPNLSFSLAPPASNNITEKNSHTRRQQRAITSEGGHTKDAPPITSEGSHSLTESRSPQPVPKRLLRNGHCPHGHRPRGITIGLRNTKQTPSSTPSPEKKWNTWHL